MPDTYGLNELPIQPAAIGPNGLPTTAVSDRLLDVLGSFLKAFINRYGQDAWQSVMPNALPVMNVRINDPEEVEFNEKDLPCLFVWRAGTGDKAPDNIAEDIWLMRDVVQILWVAPPARQAFLAFRGQFVSGVSKLIHVALEQGRDPSWVWPGDPDPTAAAQGSVFPRIAGLIEVNLSKWSPMAIGIPLADGDTRNYPALSASLDVVELYEIDITRFGANSLNQKIFDPTNTLLVDERTIPAP